MWGELQQALTIVKCEGSLLDLEYAAAGRILYIVSARMQERILLVLSV